MNEKYLKSQNVHPYFNIYTATPPDTLQYYGVWGQ